MGAERHDYRDGAALAEGLAAGVAAVLAGGIATRGEAVLAVSGGSTPKRFFEQLSRTAIDWSRVTVCLVDERFVPETHSRANSGLVRRHLLQGDASKARLEPLFAEGMGVEDAARSASRRVSALPRPFDAVLLGMGGDGHTASFFPGGDRLGEALDPAGTAAVLPMHASGAGEPRLTLTLPILAEARFLALHIEGEEKRVVLGQALEPGPASDLPIRAVLALRREPPLQIFWAP